LQNMPQEELHDLAIQMLYQESRRPQQNLPPRNLPLQNISLQSRQNRPQPLHHQQIMQDELLEQENQQPQPRPKKSRQELLTSLLTSQSARDQFNALQKPGDFLLPPVQQQHRSPVNSLPLPRFNTPSPAMSRSSGSIFSSVGKAPSIASLGSSHSGSSLGCTLIAPSPDAPTSDVARPSPSSALSARRQLIPQIRGAVAGPSPRPMFRLATASSSPSGLQFRLLTADSVRTSVSAPPAHRNQPMESEDQPGSSPGSSCP
jgi:hypothetical protein